MPKTTVLPRRPREPAGRAVTVVIAGGCYAVLLGVIAAPLVGAWQTETAAPGAREPAGPYAVRAEAGRGFAVPVDDPLLVNEQVYRLLADRGPTPMAAAGTLQAASVEAVPAKAIPDEAIPVDAASEPVVPPRHDAPAVAEPPASRAAAPLPPAAPVDRASLAVGTSQAAHAGPEPFVGVWSTQPGACSAQPSRNGTLLAAIDESGAWAGTTRCAFRDRRRTAEGWSLTAQCASPRERWTARVRLRLDGNRLHWASQRGSQTYVRCERRLVTAEAG